MEGDQGKVTKIKTYEKRLEALRAARSEELNDWQELANYHLGYVTKHLRKDRKGNKRNHKLLNNQSLMSARTLQSGMMAGNTSPARPWFRLEGPGDLKEYEPVKIWTHQVQQKIYKVFSVSNFYNALHRAYGTLGIFGVAPVGMFHDFNKVINCQVYPIGSFMLAGDPINTMYREFTMTVGQLVKFYGIDNVSKRVRKLWNEGGSEIVMNVVHAIEPNDTRDQNSVLARNKKFRSVHFEVGSRNNESKILRESGYDRFPILCPRWETEENEAYPVSSPGFVALGDTKGLQLLEKTSFRIVENMADPPVIVDGSLRDQLSKGYIDPGDVIFGTGATGGAHPVYQNYQPRLDYVENLINKHEQRISGAFYEDLFLMLANSDRREITAREVAERHEEKLLMLGPVLEQLHTELLAPSIDIVFDILQDAGALPPAPQELDGVELKVEFISILAQAQRVVAASAITEFTGFVANLSAVWPEARHKVDPHQAVDEYANALGVNPKIVRGDEEAAGSARAEQEAMQQQQAMDSGAEQFRNFSAGAKDVDQLEQDGNVANILKNIGLSQ